MLQMFSVFDKAVGAFMPPYFCKARGEAIRMFSDAVNEQNSPFFKHPGDFELYAIGRFDPATGSLEQLATERVLGALDVTQKVS